MGEIQGTQEVFTRIPGSLLEDSGECCNFSFPRNAQEVSGKCSKSFTGMLLIFTKDSMEF